MPSLSSKQASEPLHALIMGDNGSGKSGALWSLAKAGYELFILDYDNGLDILRYLAKSDPVAAARVHTELLMDKSVSMPASSIGMGIPIAQAFVKGLQLCNKWVDSETKEDFGAISSWKDPKRILVMDTLTFCGKAALNYTLMLNKKAGDHATLPNWGDAMSLTEQFLGKLCGETNCHVIVNAHIIYQQRAEGMMRGLPMALGEKLPPKIGGFFNTMLIAKSKGVGDNSKRVLLTKPDGILEAKCAILDAPRELSVETGLAELFQAWDRGSFQTGNSNQTPTKVQAQ